MTATQPTGELRVIQEIAPDGPHWCVVRDGEMVAMLGDDQQALSDAHLFAICVNAVQRLVTEVKSATQKLVQS